MNKRWLWLWLAFGVCVAALLTFVCSAPQLPKVIGSVGKDAAWRVISPGEGGMGESGWTFIVRDESRNLRELRIRYGLLLNRSMKDKNYRVTVAIRGSPLGKGQIAGLMLFGSQQDFQMIWLSASNRGLDAHYGGTAGVSFGTWETNTLASGEDGGFLAVLRLEQRASHCRAYVLDADSSWVQIGDAVLTGGHGYRPMLFASRSDVAVDFQRFRIELPESGKGEER